MSYRTTAARMIAVGLRVVGWTCRVRTHRDLRHVVRRDENAGYIFAALHAHQIGAAICGDVETAAMVSRSGDGSMIVPTLKQFGIRTIRGSGGGTRKGGARAMIEMTRHVRDGGTGFLAVDGPNGPRGHVHRGVAMLAKKSQRPVFAVVVVCNRKWTLSRTWDKLQIPKPFSRITVHFSRPMRFEPHDTLDSFADQVERELAKMERWYCADAAPAILPFVGNNRDEQRDEQRGVMTGDREQRRAA